MAEDKKIILASEDCQSREVHARIQLLVKGEVVKIMENNVVLPQVANVNDRMPRKRVPQPARMCLIYYRQ